eukprot:366444-Chlamydomonas_euryale.AAC.40
MSVTGSAWKGPSAAEVHKHILHAAQARLFASPDAHFDFICWARIARTASGASAVCVAKRARTLDACS